MNIQRLKDFRRFGLLIAMLLCWCLPQLAGAAPQFLPPTSPITGHIAPGQSSPTPDYYTTANWANSPPLAKFVDTLPLLGTTNASTNNLGQRLPVAIADTETFPGSDYYIIRLEEYYEQMHSDLEPTKLRGYVQVDSNGQYVGGVTKPHYLGPIIVAKKDRPVRLKFINGLPTGEGGDLFIPVDESVMGAGEGPIPTEKYTQNRANIHLHGGRTPWISDGTPHQWIVPAGENTPYQQGVSLQNVPDMCFDASGTAIPRPADPSAPYCLTGSTNPGPGASTYYFTNQQSTRLMFYHDHAFGITRLNVYAGMAAGYVITDSMEQDLVDRGVIPSDMIPLIIQDKTFVNDDVKKHPKSGGTIQTIRETDPLWNWGSKPKVNGVVPPTTGDLWMPHVYMPAQLPEGSATGGVNPYGRWMYGPWFYPATAVTHGPVTNPYYDPNCSSTDPFILATCQTPGQPTKIPGTPNVSMGMEAFQDSVVVNGTAFPTITVEAKPYRLRILNAASDRFQNLSFYVADSDPENVSIDSRLPADPFTAAADERGFFRSNQTEVKMAPASPALAAANNWPARWPVDGREELVPDPGTCQPGGINCSNLGPDFIQIGTEGGFLPFPAVRVPQPVTYITDPTAFWVGVVDKTGLALGPAERADTIVDFSKYAGKTLILYNDAPAAWPARVPGYDYFTGAADMRDSGGYGAGGVLDEATGAYIADPDNPSDVPHGILPGYAPNTRTVLQVIVKNGQGSSFNSAKLEKEFTSAAPGSTGIYPAGQTLFERTQDPIIVGQAAYSSAYPNSYFPANFPWEGVNQINDEFLQFVTLAGDQVKIPTEPKGIHDEMGASFDPEYGRMSGNLAMQLQNASTLNALLVLYGFSDIPTETVMNSPTLDIQVIPGNPGTIADGTQIWKISHNGVDTHPIHFHIFDVQLINRVGWDGQIAMPEANELGWKDTVKISPLMDTIVAVRPRAPSLPFGIPKSLRPLNPAIPIDSAMDFTTPPQVPGNSSWFLGNSFLTPFTGKYGFSSIDWVTGEAYGNNGVPVPYDYYKGVVTNVLYDFGWEYVWHCHILSHEEMDMMRPIVLKVDTVLPPAFSAAATSNGGSVSVTWNDPTPIDYVNLADSYDPANEVGFNVYRSADGITFNKLNSSILLANSTGFTDNSPLAGSVYKVEAFNASGSTFTPVTSSATVSLTTTSPGPFNAPAVITFNASVSGIPLGVSVTKVDFYNGATLLFSDTAAPYSYTWNDVMGGDYTIIAKATDSKGAVASASRTITVNSPLTANFSISNATIPAATDIGFCDAITLTDTSSGSVTSRSWSIGGTDPAVTIPPSLPGVYPVTLTVTGIGNNGLTETASVTKNIIVVNHAPTVFHGGPYSVNPGAPLILNGSGNDNLDSCSTAPLSYAWNVDNKGAYDFFTANPTVTNAQVNTVLGAGTHPMTFKVTDSNGAATTATTAVAVIPATPAQINVPLASVNGSYKISWTASTIPNVVFELQEATILTPAADWATEPVYTGAANSFTVTGKANGTTHYYRVRAIAADGTLPTNYTTTTDNHGCTTTFVAISSPVNGAILVQGATTTITVTLPTPPDGATLSSLQLYSGANLQTTTQINANSFSWIPAVGVTSHTLTVRATYSNGQVSTSAAVNVQTGTAVQTITLDTPANGAVFDLGTPITLQATPTSIGAVISWVAYYDGATRVDFTDVAPYNVSYTPLTAGVKSLTAKAFYDSGLVATSTAKSITINGQVIAPASITTTPATTSTTGDYTVSWTAAVPATVGATFTLQESTDPLFGTFTETLNAGVSASFTNKANGTYYYRVRAEKAPMTPSAWVGRQIVVNRPIYAGTLTPSVLSPQYKGSTINFVATAQGGTGAPYEYEFWRRSLPAGGWAVVQNYSTTNILAWDTTTSATGNYELTVRVRNQGQTAYFQVTPQIAYTINVPAPTNGTLSPNIPSPQFKGSTINFVATALGGTGAPYEYEFWLHNLSTGAWTITQNYSISNTLSWNTAAVAVGNYELTVRIRNQGQVGYFQVSPNISYIINSTAPLSGALSAGVPSPQVKGASITFTTTGVTGGTGALYEYEFWVQNLTTGVWSIARNYSTANAFTWNTAALSAGNYALTVRIRNQGQTQYFQVSPNISYTLIAPAPTNGSLSSGDIPSPQPKGATVSFIAGATGGTGTPYEYEFWVQNLTSGVWSIAQNYSTVNTLVWNTATLSVGNYALTVRIRNQGQTAYYQVSPNVSYSLF